MIVKTLDKAELIMNDLHNFANLIPNWPVEHSMNQKEILLHHFQSLQQHHLQAYSSKVLLGPGP